MNVSKSDMDITHPSSIIATLIYVAAVLGLSFSLPLHELDLIRSIHEDNRISLSGCQANETSADMNPHGDGGKSYGAFSNAVQIVLK
ncbi:hypothetical protein Tco_0112086 [Tanacetum coccineum]